MNHLGTVTLETQRLLLRKFTLEDPPAAFVNWTSDAQVTKFLRWPTAQSVADTQEVIRSWVENYRDPSFYQWAILLKENDIGPIGTISVVDRKESLDLLHIGYCIGSRWWRQGITSEAFSAVIAFLFEEVKVNRIESQHDPNNPHSGDVMRRCGLRYEGTLRQADFNNQGIVDAAMYSILAQEYFAAKG